MRRMWRTSMLDLNLLKLIMELVGLNQDQSIEQNDAPHFGRQDM